MFLEFNKVSQKIRNRISLIRLVCTPVWTAEAFYVSVSDMSLAVRNFWTVPKWWISFNSVHVALFCFFTLFIPSDVSICVCVCLKEFLTYRPLGVISLRVLWRSPALCQDCREKRVRFGVCVRFLRSVLRCVRVFFAASNVICFSSWAKTRIWVWEHSNR